MKNKIEKYLKMIFYENDVKYYKTEFKDNVLIIDKYDENIVKERNDFEKLINFIENNFKNIKRIDKEDKIIIEFDKNEIEEKIEELLKIEEKWIVIAVKEEKRYLDNYLDDEYVEDVIFERKYFDKKEDAIIEAKLLSFNTEYSYVFLTKGIEI